MCLLTIGFFDERTVRVNACSPLGLQFAQSQDIFQAIESHLNYFGVHECEEVTERFYTAKLHEVPGGEWSTQRKLSSCHLFTYILFIILFRHFLLYGEDLHLICSAEPPEVALVMAQAASFLVRNSATCRIVMRGCRRSASITIYKQGNVRLVLYTLSYHI